MSSGWGGRIRTCESRDQNPLPYRLATPHDKNFLLQWGHSEVA